MIVNLKKHITPKLLYFWILKKLNYLSKSMIIHDFLIYYLFFQNLKIMKLIVGEFDFVFLFFIKKLFSKIFFSKFVKKFTKNI